jgi:hypothetical protein
MTSARPLAGQVQPVRNVRQPIAQSEPVRNVRQPISKPAFVPQEEAAMEEVGEDMLEETTVPDEVVEHVEEETVAITETVEEEVEAKTTMARPTAMLKPIRGTLQPLVEEEEVRTAPLTPVGHMLMPVKKRGPPPSIGKPKTAELRPVKGSLIPVSKTPVKQLKTDEENEED